MPVLGRAEQHRTGAGGGQVRQRFRPRLQQKTGFDEETGRQHQNSTHFHRRQLGPRHLACHFQCRRQSRPKCTGL